MEGETVDVPKNGRVITAGQTQTGQTLMRMTEFQCNYYTDSFLIRHKNLSVNYRTNRNGTELKEVVRTHRTLYRQSAYFRLSGFHFLLYNAY